MQEQNWNIITKHLSKESSEEENNALFAAIEKDKKLKAEFGEIKTLWNSLSLPEETFNKERILKLISTKTGKHKKQRSIIQKTLKYAAVFVGLLMITTYVYMDLTSIKTLTNNTDKIQEIKLPDNSIIILNANAKIEYNNSILKTFNREVNIDGEAFFKITKSKNKKFTVHTSDFDINVLGTEFNVRTYKKNQSVVLTEGKVLLNSFKNPNAEMTMKPGEIVKFNKEKNIFISQKINSKIYTSWLNKKLEFDNFSLKELSELIKLRYNKDLIITNKEIANKKISGTAPADDLNLLLKALETILKTEIQHKENQLLIN